MILVMGDPRDLHVARVTEAIRARGRQAVVFARHSADCRMSIEARADGTAVSFSVGEHRVPAEDVSSIWWRQKPFQYFYDKRGELADVELFADREWQQPQQSLTYFLCDLPIRWFNHVDRQRHANLKPVQLGWAVQAGFSVPDTLFSNDKGAIARFVAARPSIYKTFASTVTDNDKFIFTTPVTTAMIDERDAASFAIAPGIFQEYVEKAFELRITVVDDRIFAIRIDSQRNDDTAIDWRRDQAVNIYERYELSEAHEGIVRAFVRMSGLRFGAIDAVIGLDGKLWFLECNPAGQWLWLEEFTGLPICDAVAEALCEGSAAP